MFVPYCSSRQTPSLFEIKLTRVIFVYVILLAMNTGYILCTLRISYYSLCLKFGVAINCSVQLIWDMGTGGTTYLTLMGCADYVQGAPGHANNCSYVVNHRLAYEELLSGLRGQSNQWRLVSGPPCEVVAGGAPFLAMRADLLGIPSSSTLPNLAVIISE